MPANQCFGTNGEPAAAISAMTAAKARPTRNRADSPNFGVCLCIGTWAEGGKWMGMEPVAAVHHFGKQGRLFKIHFRNVDRPLPKFREVFVDNGYLDMYQVMRALREENFQGIIIPDHVPGGGYPQVNTSYTLGYMKALRDRVNAEMSRG